MKAGLFFSAAFTLQRALASQLAYFALAGFLMHSGEEEWLYIVVGFIMFVSGYFIRYRNKVLHLLPWFDKWLPSVPEEGQVVPVKLALIHGFVAGWGTGAFATIIYTVISPAMPFPWLGFLPGLLFGLGTMAMQILIGALFGRWMARQKLDHKAKAFVGRFVAGNTLLYGGILFALVGALGKWFPALTNWSVATGIPVHNLDSINIGLLLVIAVVGGAGGASFWHAIKKARLNAPAR
jgi:uncharacterized membrane protein YsdA (DUF1294 family)